MVSAFIEAISWLGYTIFTFGYHYMKAIIQTIIGLKPFSKITKINYGQIIMASLGITGIIATIILVLIKLIIPTAKKLLNKKVF